MKMINKSLLTLLYTIGVGLLPAFAFATIPDQTTFHIAARYWYWDYHDENKREREKYNQWCKKHPKKCQEERERHRTWCENHPQKCAVQRWERTW